ncbi:hypothetical protein BJV85_001104 [Clostridium acetobutylicum]|uniref:Uncharacterized protein n=1 Tax=Clostridium acetobutylicum (strain ATCC 824 / DSM 792 / JCM 1419 / IAM 19013 / LMG 5710 / NBRC 13948 / NRRL B-527 / VKM B-1787 / 2291 / W) TaxID=272562 RepID=Q97FF1_CLOAB|nr:MULTISPECIES: hypothetical protein [Clostridium]AAK80733.1 Hypothetical protein CA_C2789 [Clostridium acetobutylicum ATCC 824]ADZ21834.1 Conserved hypothetical protein [Clostridium acetobutylicum EA 2018]AEI32551.1 hypothetical protein SMB_G2825 [Clostridium acetobutylicum DSM 1731]AWV78853.1 hypothetical protein DK921_01750 [Clostridium acetobutylicum]KHD37099.1 hypothetical protein NL50_07150 [Clostridium acetobutylicum]
MNQIYKRNKYVIVPVCNDYLVINTNKVFKKGHTHVKKINTAKMLINFAIFKEIPKNPYFIGNLIRISDDESYIEKLKVSSVKNKELKVGG